MNLPKEQVVIGRFGRPHGVKGWIYIHSFTEPFENILSYQPWIVNGAEIKYTEVEHHAKGIVALLENIHDRDIVSRYTQQEIAVPRTSLPSLPENEYYWRDLEHLEVINQEGVSLGKVDYLFRTGSNDVLVINDSVRKRQHLVPYLMGNTLLKVDLEKKIIYVDWDPSF